MLRLCVGIVHGAVDGLVIVAFVVLAIAADERVTDELLRLFHLTALQPLPHIDIALRLIPADLAFIHLLFVIVFTVCGFVIV